MRLFTRPLPEKVEGKQHGINMVDLMMWLVIAAMLLAAAIQSIGYYQKAAFLYQMNAEVEVVAGKITAAAAIDGTVIESELISRIVAEENAARPNDPIVITVGSLASYAAGDTSTESYGFERASVVTAATGGQANYIKTTHTEVPDRESVYFFSGTASYKAGINVVDTGSLDEADPTTPGPTTTATPPVTETPSPTATATPTTTTAPTPTPTFTTVNWTARPNSVTTNAYRAAASSDLSRILAGGSGATPTYLSTDGGTSWKLAYADGTMPYHGGAISNDGMKMVSGRFNNDYAYLFTSIDGGANWTKRTGAGKGNWEDFSISDDGTKMVASDNGSYGGLWVSTDSGETWAKKTANGNGATSLAGTADGQTIWATSSSGVRVSNDYGNTWVAKTGILTSGLAVSSSVSPDGKYIAIGTSGSATGVYISSDSGATWEKRNIGNKATMVWQGIAVSDNGNRLAASDYYNRELWFSLDSGATWQQAAVPLISWRSVMVSADGTKFIAVGLSGQIYTGALG